jgi:hypothetical protein
MCGIAFFLRRSRTPCSTNSSQGCVVTGSEDVRSDRAVCDQEPLSHGHDAVDSALGSITLRSLRSWRPVGLTTWRR